MGLGCTRPGRCEERRGRRCRAHRQGAATRQRPVLVQPAGTSIFPAGSSSLLAFDAHGIAALLAPSPTGNIDVADPSHFPDKLLGHGQIHPAPPPPPPPS